MTKKAVAIVLILIFTACFFEPLALAKDQPEISCDWPMFGKTPDGNRLVESDCGLTSTQLCKLWETRFTKDNMASPAIWQNRLYLSDWSKLLCYNLEDRSIIWEYDSQANVNFTHTIDSNKIYILQYDYKTNTSKLVCLDALTGSMIWSQGTKTYINFYILACEGKVIIHTKDDYFHCYDGQSGEVLWEYYSEISSRPVIANNMLYLTGIKCLDATTGKVVWENRFSMFEYITIDGNKLYSVVVDKDKVNITSFSAETGDRIDSFLWVTTDKIQMVRNLSVVKSKLYVSTIKTSNMHAENAIFCFDLETRKILWSLDTGDHMLCYPTFDNGNIVVGSNLGMIMFIDMNTGKIVQTYNIDQPIGYELVIASKKLFIPTKKALFCFEGEM